jgi:hypothetical protein
MTKDYCPLETAVAVREQGDEGDVWTQRRGGNRRMLRNKCVYYH